MKKHLLTCAIVLSLIAGTFFIVFTFENMVFALARVQFLPTSASYRGDSVGKESKEFINPDPVATEDQLHRVVRTPPADTNQNSARTIAVTEIAQAAAKGIR